MRAPTPAEIALFERLSGPAAAEEVAALRRAVARHVDEVRQAAHHNELLPVDLAEQLAAGLDTLLGALPSLAAEAQPLVIGAARYFVSDDDAIPDTASVLGLDDDIAVFNAMVRRIGRRDLGDRRVSTVGELPPGSRVRVRGEEWAVERSLPLPQGGVAVHVQGLSELVRHHKAIFVTGLDRVEVLRPEDTKLVADDSPGYRRTRLFLETLLRRTPPTDARIHLAHRAALDLMPYQLQPTHKALGALRPRLLIADGTGLGKTVEVGILLAELIKRGRARRILVVAIKSMLAQLQRELWARFTIPLVRLDSEGLRRVEQKIPSNRNPFSYYDRCIISVDTLKNNPRYRAWLEHIRWDVIVVDECHNVANRGSQREQLARLLAAQCDALVLTSATPHNGRPESFANLMRMLDPTAIADERSFAREDVQHLFVRRFKKDVEGQAGESLRERRVHVHQEEASAAEEEALAALHALELRNLGRKRHAIDKLLRWALVKAFLSSPQAALDTLDERIKKTEEAIAPDHKEGPHPYAVLLRNDLGKLRDARDKVAAATSPSAFGKLNRLVKELRALGFTGKATSPRVVIFSERIATLDLLQKEIAREFSISNAAEVIGRFDASDLTDVQQREVVESFGREHSPMRLLLASDAASEGVNLHYHCAQLFHFDIPWSLIRLTQRNGRIDRFGQKHEPHLRYLMTRTKDATADQHVAARLVEKEDAASKQLGDVGTLLGLYDPEAEDKYITEGIAEGRSAEELIPEDPLDAGEAEAQLEMSAIEKEAGDAIAVPPPEPPPAGASAADVDLIAMLQALEGGGAPAPAAPLPARAAEPEIAEDRSGDVDLLALLEAAEKAEATAPPIEAMKADDSTLYPDDYTFVVAALRHLEKHPVVGEAGLKWEADDAHRALKITVPEPFRVHREPFLPAEALRDGGPYQLVQSREEVKKRLRRALEGDGSWPEWHLLWEQHPLVDWLLDALAASYARHEAPVVRIPALPREAAFFLVEATQYNHESEPVFASWFAVEARGQKIQDERVAFRDLAERVGLLGDSGQPGRGLRAHGRAARARARGHRQGARSREGGARGEPQAAPPARAEGDAAGGGVGAKGARGGGGAPAPLQGPGRADAPSRRRGAAANSGAPREEARAGGGVHPARAREPRGLAQAAPGRRGAVHPSGGRLRGGVIVPGHIPGTYPTMRSFESALIAHRGGT
ncbi:MAG: SNF2-related protein [Minicystis sp.]